MVLDISEFMLPGFKPLDVESHELRSEIRTLALISLFGSLHVEGMDHTCII
jgi:hypothetical protein